MAEDLTPEEFVSYPLDRYTITQTTPADYMSGLPFYTVWSVDEEGFPECDVYESFSHTDAAQWIEQNNGELILGVTVPDFMLEQSGSILEQQIADTLVEGNMRLAISDDGFYPMTQERDIVSDVFSQMMRMSEEPFVDVDDLEVALDRGHVLVDRYWVVCIVDSDFRELGTTTDADRAQRLADKHAFEGAIVIDMSTRRTMYATNVE